MVDKKPSGRLHGPLAVAGVRARGYKLRIELKDPGLKKLSSGIEVCDGLV